jgi:hypothetical protein
MQNPNATNSSIAWATAGGAVNGFITSIVPGTVVGSWISVTAKNALLAAAGDAAQQFISNGEVKSGELGIQFLLGGIVGRIANEIGLATAENALLGGTSAKTAIAQSEGIGAGAAQLTTVSTNAQLSNESGGFGGVHGGGGTVGGLPGRVAIPSALYSGNQH